MGLRYSFICHGTTTRRQRRDLFVCGMKLLLVTTSQSTQIKVEAIPLSALPKDTTSELAGLPSPYLFFMLNFMLGSCEHGRQQRGPCPPRFSYMIHTFVDRGLKVLFFGLIFRCPPSPGRGLIVLFSIFFYFSVFFSVGLHGNFSADALGCGLRIPTF